MATTKLTPAAKRERGMRLVGEGQRLIIQAELEERGTIADWYDQTTSPLGKRRHLEHARAGKFPTWKEGHKVFARRVDVDAYIEREGLARGRGKGAGDEEDVDDVVADILRSGGGRR